MSDILETLAGTCGEHGERPRKIRMMRRSTLGNFHETFRHHRDLNGREQGHESELREGMATAELAESTPPPFAISPHSQRSARGSDAETGRGRVKREQPKAHRRDDRMVGRDEHEAAGLDLVDLRRGVGCVSVEAARRRLRLAFPPPSH